MKDAVVIKSFHNGINLILNEEATFEEICEDVKQKFTDGKNFFGKSKTALTFEGKELEDEQELKIVAIIRSVCDVNIICIVDKNEALERQFVKAIDQVELRLDGDAGQFYRGTLKDNDIIETKSSIVVLGDVNPGCAVISEKNIIILGGLYGEAYAGSNNETPSYVVALEMEPERLRIGDFKYKNSKNKWGLHPKIQPKIAYTKNGKIVFENLTKELLDSFV